MEKRKALCMGRWAPSHKGHIKFIMDLTRQFDEVHIGIGSCYEVGNSRHPLLAILREKMLLLSLYHEGCDLSKIKVSHIQDFERFEDWMDHVLKLVKREGITHFVTGNKEDILNVIEEKGLELDLEFINPELTSSIPYHATDLRNAIATGDYEKFKEIAASGTIELMGMANGFEGIKEAIDNDAPSFYSGRQTADVVVTLSEKKRAPSGDIYYDDYILCGIRPGDKRDFDNYLGLPGAEIEEYESPIDTAIRALKEKVNLDVTMLDRKYEPAPVLLHTSKGKVIATLNFLKLFNSSKLAGTYGGSSQCFHIPLYGNVAEFNNVGDTPYLRDVKFMRAEDAMKQGLAYEQTAMVKAAIKRLNH